MLGPHHPVQLILQLLVDPLQRQVVALNPAAGGNRVTTCKARPSSNPSNLTTITLNMAVRHPSLSHQLYLIQCLRLRSDPS